MINYKISVIIPTYNRIELLKRAIFSVISMKYDNIEIIVIDDCSTENVQYMIEENFSKNRIVYHRNTTNMYAPYCRKKGYELSTGDFVVFLDDDDYYTDYNFFANCIEIFNDRTINMVSANANILYLENNEIERYTLNISGFISGIDYLMGIQDKYKKPLSTFTTMFRSENFINEDMLFNDSIFYIYSLINGNAYIINDIVGNYCVHKNNISYNVKDSLILDTLKEKYKIKLKLEDTYKFRSNLWWYKHLYITCKYYVLGKDISIENIKLLFKKIKKEFQSRYTIVYLIILVRKLISNEH